MAKSTTNVKDFQKKSKDGVIPVRPIGGRVLLPGVYNFDANPSLRYEERPITNSDRTYLQVEVKSDHGWVDLAQLMKRGKTSKYATSIDYINEWIRLYSDVSELALALAGNTLVVTTNRCDTYSIYRNGQTVPAYINGYAYKAELKVNDTPKYTEPRP